MRFVADLNDMHLNHVGSFEGETLEAVLVQLKTHRSYDIRYSIRADGLIHKGGIVTVWDYGSTASEALIFQTWIDLGGRVI